MGSDAKALCALLAMLSGVMLLAACVSLVDREGQMPVVSASRVGYILGGLFVLNQIGWFMLRDRK